jgi:hypothetical protein
MDEKQYIPPAGSKWHKGTGHVETNLRGCLLDLGFDIPPDAIIHDVVGLPAPYEGLDSASIRVIYTTEEDTPSA